MLTSLAQAMVTVVLETTLSVFVTVSVHLESLLFLINDRNERIDRLSAKTLSCLGGNKTLFLTQDYFLNENK